MNKPTWLQLAAANTPARDAAKLMECSLGNAAKQLSRANGTLERPTAARLQEGLFEAASEQCRLQIVTVEVPRSRAMADALTGKRGPRVQERIRREDEMQRGYNSEPFEGATNAHGRPLPALAA